MENNNQNECVKNKVVNSCEAVSEVGVNIKDDRAEYINSLNFHINNLENELKCVETDRDNSKYQAGVLLGMCAELLREETLDKEFVTNKIREANKEIFEYLSKNL